MISQRYVGSDLSLYDHGFPEDPELLDLMRGETAPEIVRIAALYGATAYRRAFDDTVVFAEPETRKKAKSMLAAAGGEHVRMPASVLVRIVDARIQDRAVYLARGEATLPLYETQRQFDRPYVTVPDTVRPPELLPDDRAYLLLTSSGSFNWGHFLIDDLPKFKAIAVAQALERRPLCLLLHGFVPAVDRQRIALLHALLGSDIQVRLLRPDTHYRADVLYFPTPISTSPKSKHPQALADLAAAGAALAKCRDWRTRLRRSGRSTKLFVLRRRDRGRVPIEWDAVHTYIAKRGYVPFDPEGTPAAEQAAVFASAQRVVGYMGAAMAGSLFCREGARILYLAPDTFLDPFYLDLAATRGHAYAVYYGTALQPDYPEYSNYTVDFNRLHEALAWLERDD